MGKCVSLLFRLTLIIIIVIIRCTLNFGKCYKVFHQVYGSYTVMQLCQLGCKYLDVRFLSHFLSFCFSSSFPHTGAKFG